MRRPFGLVLWGTLFAALAITAGTEFELQGNVSPACSASVSLFSSNSPFSKSVLTSQDGHFRFRGLLPGTYTVSAFAPGKGEFRRTIEIGPGTADPRGRVKVLLDLSAAPLTSAGSGHTVSVGQLSISEAARRSFSRARGHLAKRNTDRAIQQLERAVQESPGFVDAWNLLGTIAYQTRRYSQAEQYFRQALAHDPAAFEPLVNLGGALLTLGKLDEAWKYNLYAVLARPTDALANAQLGMTYFELNKPGLAVKYLEEAKRIDPVHFSLPQLTLAEIFLRQQQPARAIAELEELLHYHPDAPNAPAIRETIRRLCESVRPPEAPLPRPVQ